jgi:hypothetical protein
MAVDTRRAAERLAPVFQANDWRWVGTANGVPTVDEIEHQIAHMIDRVEREPLGDPGDHSYIATGRLQVTRYHFKGGDIETQVCLEVGTSFDTDDPLGT